MIRAGEQLSSMLAGAAAGRHGRLAAARPHRRSRRSPICCASALGLTGMHPALLHTLSFVIALALVVTLHVLLGEMVPKNIALAGPERTAMLLVPPYLAYVRAARPFIVFYNKCANAVLRVLRVEPKDELDITVSTVELSEMIAESVSEGLLDPEEHTRLTRALQIRTRVVGDVAVAARRRSARCRWRAGRFRADGRRGRTGPGPDRLLPVSGRRPRRQVHRLPAHQGRADARRRSGDGDRSGAGAPAAPVPVAAAGRRPVADAPQQQPPGTGDRRSGGVVAMVAMEDLVEDLVGTHARRS